MRLCGWSRIERGIVKASQGIGRDVSGIEPGNNHWGKRKKSRDPRSGDEDVDANRQRARVR
jgi:hypothetical protein